MMQKDLILELAQKALTGSCVTDLSKVEPDKWRTTYQLAKLHSIAALLYEVAADYIKEDESLADMWKTEREKAMVRELTFDGARTQIYSALEEAGIRYLPLKGVIINKMYGQPGRRTFSDNDILYDESCRQKLLTIMAGLGYELVSKEQDHHDIFTKAPVLNFEMHKTLMDSDSQFEKYYEDIFDRAIREEGSQYAYRMTDEDFYIFFMVHMYEHYCEAGIGLRFINDMYVIRRQLKYNRDIVKKELKKLKLDKFHETFNVIVDYVFDGGSLNEEARQMLKYIVTSGIYGNQDNVIDNRMQKSSNKLGYVITRIFLPYSEMKKQYPVLEKWKILLPFMWVHRWFAVLFSKNRRSNAAKEVQKLKKQ